MDVTELVFGKDADRSRHGKSVGTNAELTNGRKISG